MADQSLVDQILQLISQLSPEDVQSLIAQIEAASGEQETAEPQGAPGGTVAPEAGPTGVPVKM